MASPGRCLSLSQRLEQWSRSRDGSRKVHFLALVGHLDPWLAVFFFTLDSKGPWRTDVSFFCSASQALPCPLPTLRACSQAPEVTGTLTRALHTQKESQLEPGRCFLLLPCLCLGLIKAAFSSRLFFPSLKLAAPVTSHHFPDVFLPNHEPPQPPRERGTCYKKEALLLITLKLQRDWPEGTEPGLEVLMKAGAVNPAGPAVAGLPLVASNQRPFWEPWGQLTRER